MSTIATPAAPAAPNTPAPITPAAPAAAPAPAAKNEFDNAWDKADAIAPKPEPKPEPKPAEPKPAVDKPKEPAAPPAPPKDDPKAPKQLREQLEKRNKEYGELETKFRDAEKRIADADAKGKDTTALSERLATLERQIQEKESEIRGLRQEASPEFKEKYDKPFEQSAEYAKSVVEGLTIYEQDAQGNEVTRPAKWDDFAALYQMPKGKALPLIAKLFKEAGPVVTQELLSLQKLDLQRQNALADERNNYAAKEKERAANTAKEKEFISATWTKVNRDIAAKSEFFQPDPNDAEASRLLADGYKLVDSEPATLQERIIHDAQIRNRAAAHSRMRHEVTKYRERIKELEATIAEMKGSEPGAVHRPGGGDAKPAEKDWKTELRESGAISRE